MMSPAGPPKGRKEPNHREDLKAAFERFRAAVRELCPSNVQNRLLQSVDTMEQGLMAARLPPESARSSFAQVRGHARRSMREVPTDMVHLLKAIDGMEEEMNRFFAALDGSS